MPFEATPDRTLVRTRGGSRRYVKLYIEAPAALDERPRPPVNLAVVVDRSGSMHGEKIERAREAALHTVRSLRDGDRLALVAYNDSIDVLMPSVTVDAGTRREAEDAVSGLYPRGMTNLCKGWLRGCEQVGRHLGEDRVGRALLMSDGLANRGITDREEILAHAAELRARGVATSTFGIGNDFDEVLLAGMAEAGGGNFYYVETPDQIPDFVASEVGESLDVVAREAAVVVRAPQGATVRSLNGYPVTRDGAVWRVALGALVSRQRVEPALEIEFPAAALGDCVTVTISLDDADDVIDQRSIDLTYRYAGDEENDRQPRDLEVDRSIASLFAASARRQALQLNRDGRFREAREAMLACAERIATYAGDDPELNRTLAEVRDGAERYQQRLSARQRKSTYSEVVYSMKTRGPRGASRRGAARGRLVLLPLLGQTHRLVRRAALSAKPAIDGLFADVDISDALLTAFEGAEREGGELSPQDEDDVIRAAWRAAPSAGIRIVTTTRHLDDNWFSHWHARPRTAVSSLFGWDRTATVAPEAFVVYEMLLYGLHALSPRFDVLAMAHEDTRGCLFDFCAQRADIEIKLQTMDLCPTCERALARLRVDLRALRDVCEAVRELARPVRPRPAAQRPGQ